MLNILKRIDFENNCWVGLVDSSNFNNSEEDRIQAVTDLASITKGKLRFDTLIDNSDGGDISLKHWNKRVSLYNRLQDESNGQPSVPFEFVPIVKYGKGSEIIREEPNYLKYGIYDDEVFYTNLRNVLNYGYDDDFSSANSEEQHWYNGFKVIVGRVPIKVISHLRTHRAFSWLVESSRNKRYLDNVEFWYPSWWNKTPYFELSKIDDDRILVHKLKEDIEKGLIKPEEATMELSDRRLVHFAMAAWKQDTNAWNNLFAVRGDKTGTMSITGMTVDNIKQLVNEWKET